MSDSAASVTGGKEIILLCEKVTKGKICFFLSLLKIFNQSKTEYLDDIQIRFFEEKDGFCIWESYADFQPIDVHKQVAISFKVPMYKTMQVNLII